MNGRPDREGALIDKARICHAFHIGWKDYGNLTRREQLVLLDLLTPAAPEQSEAPHAVKPPPRPGMERVC